MITVTTPSTVNAITLLTEGTSNQATISSTTIPNEGFTNALNAQIGLAAATPESTALITAQTALLNATTTTTETTTLSAQQPNVLIDTSVDNLSALNSPETTISAQDEAILSNVNDTLKFITANTKLGDKLPNVRLQTANTLTPTIAPTSQTVQSAINNQATNTQVNTPATVLSQQAIPVQVKTIAVETPQTDIDITDVLLNVENALEEQSTQKSTVTTQAQIQTSIAQTPTTEKTATTASLIVTSERPVAATSELIETPDVNTEISEKTAATPQNQMPVAQAVMKEKSVVTTQSQMPVAPTETSEKLAATPVQVQTLVVPTKGTEKPVVKTQNQMPVAQTETLDTLAITTTQTQVERTASNLSETSKLIVSSTVQQSVNKNESKIADENTQTTSTLLTEITTSNESKNMVSDTVAKSDTPKSATSKTDDKVDNNQVIQITEQTISPIVTAQAIPIETKSTNLETTTPEDKPTLTPAKNLLADVLANRHNNSNDTAGSDKKGSDTPTNAMLQNENLLNTSPNEKQSAFEAKSFASLLEAEKSEVTMTNVTTQTGDKSTPQVMTAVNKLAETMKSEVPALTRPLSHPNWNDDLGERIVWMNNRNISSAEIRMNPQHMGPITVRIDMNQDQATIAFTAQNADVRTALESAIPKLRDMLSSQNVNLADVNVSQQSSTNSDSNRSQQQTAQMAADTSGNGQGGNRQNQEMEVDANGNVMRETNSGEGIVVDEFVNGQVLQDNGANGLLSLFA